jgi:hypothetical protein
MVQMKPSTSVEEIGGYITPCRLGGRILPGRGGHTRSLVDPHTFETAVNPCGGTTLGKTYARARHTSVRGAAPLITPGRPSIG